MDGATTIRIHKTTRNKLRDFVERGFTQSFVLDKALKLFESIHVNADTVLVSRELDELHKKERFWNDDSKMQEIHSFDLACLLSAHSWDILLKVARTKVEAEHGNALSGDELSAAIEEKHDELFDDFQKWIADFNNPTKKHLMTASLLNLY